jgi:hypothetical protein
MAKFKGEFFVRRQHLKDSIQKLEIRAKGGRKLEKHDSEARPQWIEGLQEIRYGGIDPFQPFDVGDALMHLEGEPKGLRGFCSP